MATSKKDKVLIAIDVENRDFNNKINEIKNKIAELKSDRSKVASGTKEYAELAMLLLSRKKSCARCNLLLLM